MNREVDLVVVGNLLIDELPGGKLEPGGAALYTCLAAARCGLRVGLHSVVGDDYPLELLERAGVQLSLHRLSGPGGRVLISYGPEGRSLQHKGPGHHAMTPQEPQPFRTKYVHVAPMPWECQVFHLSQCEEKTALLDPYPVFHREGWEQLRPLVNRLAYLVLNEEELEMELESLPSELPVLLKQGARGGYYRPTGERWAAQECELRDPTGAGDSFVAGVAAGLVRGLTRTEQFQLGAQMAAQALGAVGPWGLVEEEAGS